METPMEFNSLAPRILIAEDSPTQAMRLAHILKRQGYQIEIAGNGREALEIAGWFRPVLLISDVVMPEMGGYELSTRIKAHRDLRDISVILVTTMSDSDDVIRGLKCGADNFILKPFEEGYLLGRVRYVLANREMRRAEEALMGLEIHFNGERHLITADRLQILNLLLSTYDATVQRNKELTRKHEELQALNVKFEAANRAKGDFLAFMSHEIRTPMNGVIGMLELLGMTKLDSDQRATLGVVRESGASLLRIIDDILDLSKIEEGKLEVHPEPASVADVVERVVSLYSGVASAKGLQLKALVDTRIDEALWLDPLRLQQILSNLVSNAVKFSPKNGHVEIGAELIDRENSVAHVAFTVKDNGIGVSAEDQKRLFHPFSQIEGRTMGKFGGTGLGLSICRRLATLMGGSVDMMSEVGVGTMMTLRLHAPVADAMDLPKDGAKNAQDPGGATKDRRRAPTPEQATAEGTLVLVVDDHPVNRMVLVRQANTLGYAAESAEGGIAALKALESKRFALVILDCNMPGMDGYELARNVRRIESENDLARTPIIACTANAMVGEADACLAAGMDDYLAKPVQLRSLREKLDRWLPLPAGAR
jgi:signal transduction histidine kinase